MADAIRNDERPQNIWVQGLTGMGLVGYHIAGTLLNLGEGVSVQRLQSAAQPVGIRGQWYRAGDGQTHCPPPRRRDLGGGPGRGGGLLLFSAPRQSTGRWIMGRQCTQ